MPNDSADEADDKPRAPESTVRAPYYAPTFQADAFNCVYCGVMAPQDWYRVTFFAGGSVRDTELQACECGHCKRVSYWHDDRMIIPAAAPGVPPHPDLPDECREDFDEAREVCQRSPKSAAESSLSRLW